MYYNYVYENRKCIINRAMNNCKEEVVKSAITLKRDDTYNKAHWSSSDLLSG